MGYDFHIGDVHHILDIPSKISIIWWKMLEIDFRIWKYRFKEWVEMYEIQKTTNYRMQYARLALRFKRFVDEAIDIIKLTPTDYQSRITYLGNRKEGGLYRFRIPGCYLMYVVPILEEAPQSTPAIILTNVRLL